MQFCTANHQLILKLAPFGCITPFAALAHSIPSFPISMMTDAWDSVYTRKTTAYLTGKRRRRREKEKLLVTVSLQAWMSIIFAAATEAKWNKNIEAMRGFRFYFSSKRKKASQLFFISYFFYSFHISLLLFRPDELNSRNSNPISGSNDDFIVTSKRSKRFKVVLAFHSFPTFSSSPQYFQFR